MVFSKIRMVRFVFFFALSVSFIALPSLTKAETGKVALVTNDIEVQLFGRLKVYPTFMNNVNFDNTTDRYNWILDENGYMKDFDIRAEARLGFLGKGKDWNFLMVFEGDFNMDKNNVDRGADPGQPLDSGMTGEDFGIEKLEFKYNFGPATILTGWNDKFLDGQTGGFVYGDDHPFIGFTGKLNEKTDWELLFLNIYDKIGNNKNPLQADPMDWRVYSLKANYKLNGFTISPFVAYSDNNNYTRMRSQVSYLGLEAYGKIGMFVPRFEIAWAKGDTTRDPITQKSYDISGLAAYASVDFEINPMFIPFVGVKWASGDDDPDDTNIDAFNGITDISRFTPTFGMENAFIYRFVPALGSHIYAGNFDYLPKALGKEKTLGYGGVGNSSSGDSPGLLMFGAGFRGTYGQLSYKLQGMYFKFDTSEGLTKLMGKPVSDKVGTEYDLQLTYKFSKNFSIGNCLSIFDPGDAMKDLWGPSAKKTAYLNTVELIWTW